MALTEAVSHSKLPQTNDRSSCHCEVMCSKSTFKERRRKKHTSMVKIIFTITMLQFIKSWYFWEVIQLSSWFKAVCVSLVVVVFVPLLRAHTHTHTSTHNRHTHTHALQHTPHVFFGERHGAMETLLLGGCVDHQEETWGRVWLSRLPRVLQLTSALVRRGHTQERGKDVRVDVVTVVTAKMRLLLIFWIYTVMLPWAARTSHDSPYGESQGQLSDWKTGEEWREDSQKSTQHFYKNLFFEVPIEIFRDKTGPENLDVLLFLRNKQKYGAAGVNLSGNRYYHWLLL